MALVLSTITTGIFAQTRPQAKELTEAQKEQMSEVKEKYAPAISDLRQEINVISTEQHGLLTSKEIDEKSIYANIDKMGQLKADMQKQTLAMRGEMKTICPSKGQTGMRSVKMHQGNKNQGKSCDNGKQEMHKKGQGVNAKKNANSSRNCAQGQKMNKGQKGQGMKSSNKGQKVKGQGGSMNEFLDLSIDQAEQISEIRTAHFWTIQETENQIALLKAKSTTSEDQLKSIDKVSALQTKLAKQKMSVKLETMKVLTEEQRIKMIAAKGQGKGHGPQKGHKKSMQGQHQKRA